MILDLPFWKNASSKRRRIYTVIFIFVLAVIVTFVASYIPISQSTASSLSNSYNSTMNMHRSNGTLPEYIFLNNFEGCLEFFIPILGPISAFLSFGYTGYLIGAISKVQGYPPWFAWVIELLTPVFWLEFTAYSIAVMESIWLTRRLFQRRWMELKNTAILIAVCAAILLVSAFIETWLVSLGI
ncbi:MAG TPA: stage II sporulation protein M [Candidatus Limnocylindrales bacterium]|nr:stage II sporulation protein M [Candidatus Limnocylindrales bacterium]